MSELKLFENREFGKVRTILLENNPYFCLVDVCKILGIGNSSDVKKRLEQDGVDTIEVIDNLGRKQKSNFINESNLYKCIFQSKKYDKFIFRNLKKILDKVKFI